MDKTGAQSMVDSDAVGELVQALESVLMRGTIPPLSSPLQQHERLNHLFGQMLDVQTFAMQLARGDLAGTLRARGITAGILKELQANLRHLTWQTQNVAQGDFNQRVDFMGDFSAAFNSMVVNLAAARAQIEQQIVERDRLIAELDAFAHTVAHDLKNPLNVLAGYAGLLGMDKDSLPSDLSREYVERIEQTAIRMDRILEELMLLSGVRKGQVQLKPVDMGELVSRTLDQMAPTIRSAHAEVHVQGSWPSVTSHGPWIEEIWANYVSNALKYGGSPPIIEIGSTPGDPVCPPGAESKESQIRNPESRVSFWVRDHGPGILPEDQVHLFTPFTRLGDLEIAGHGLGLSIVQRIVEKLGGDAGVCSSGVPGEGSLFYFSLPQDSA